MEQKQNTPENLFQKIQNAIEGNKELEDPAEKEAADIAKSWIQKQRVQDPDDLEAARQIAYLVENDKRLAFAIKEKGLTMQDFFEDKGLLYKNVSNQYLDKVLNDININRARPQQKPDLKRGKLDLLEEESSEDEKRSDKKDLGNQKLGLVKKNINKMFVKNNKKQVKKEKKKKKKKFWKKKKKKKKKKS